MLPMCFISLGPSISPLYVTKSWGLETGDETSVHSIVMACNACGMECPNMVAVFSYYRHSYILQADMLWILVHFEHCSAAD